MALQYTLWLLLLLLNGYVRNCEATLGAACGAINETAVCTVMNSECNTGSSFCACETGFTAEMGACLKAIGSSCAENTTCPDGMNLVCESDMCTCAEGFGEKNNVCTATVSGTTCTENGNECDDFVNSVCDGNTCSCSPNFVMNVDTCVAENIAASVEVGVITLLLSGVATIREMFRSI